MNRYVHLIRYFLKYQDLFMNVFDHFDVENAVSGGEYGGKTKGERGGMGKSNANLGKHRTSRDSSFPRRRESRKIKGLDSGDQRDDGLFSVSLGS
jgi:hypothetical protein